MQEMGQDPAAVLADCGLDASAFDEPDRRVPFGVAARLVQQAVRITGRPDFPLLVGQRFELGDLGLVGQLMARAHTVGEGLEDLQRFFHLQDRGSVAYLRCVEPGVMALGYSILDAGTPGAGLVYDLVMSIAQTILRTLAGPRFRATEVCLARLAPDDIAPYRRCFVAPVSFDAPQTELRFDADWLYAPVAAGDRLRHAQAQRAAHMAEAGEALSLADRTRAIVRVMLSTGRLDTARVAAAFGVHERTLRRRLAGEGVHLHELVAEARFEVARLLLAETHLPLSAIAGTLGYKQVSAFVRAFGVWAGCAPGQWRDRVAGDVSGARPAKQPRG